MKKNQGETKMQKSNSKNSTRLKENQDSQQKNGSIVSSTTSTKGDQEIKESGLFINAMVNGVQCNLLLDTGATPSIVSDRLHAEIVKTGENGLVPVTQRIVGADGTPLIVQGRGIFSIRLGQREFSTQAVVANIKADGILGLDFLQTNQCLVDACKTRMYMYVHGVEHELDLQGNIVCFRVSLCETISIPPRSEIICPGKMLDIPESSLTPLLIEPCAKFQDSGKALLARSLVNSSERESGSETDEYI